jgi:hypothetical protein
VPLCDLYETIPFICIDSYTGTHPFPDKYNYSVGEISYSTMWHYQNPNNIPVYFYFAKYFKPLAEYREERINQILS